MAGSESSGRASQLPTAEDTTIVIRIHTKLPRRQLTLIAITILLNVLLWSSLVCFTASLYQVASDISDTSSIPSEVLILTSSLTTIAYIILHTIFSLKQRIWKHQGRHPSIKKTSYIAVRFAVTLCILWLLTSGWNMITVARQPVCLSEAPGLQGWEAGSTCRVSRVGIAFSIVALMASCTLFWMLSVVRRPFEAHLLNHDFHSPSKPNLTPAVSRRPSPSRTASIISEKYRGRHVSASMRRSTQSIFSDTDIETLELDSGSPPATLHAPSPIRSIGLGIFTSNAQPPPVPPGFASHSRASSQAELPPIFYPSASNHHLPPPPRMSALIPPSGFVPLSVPAQFSASAWQAVHPPAPSPLGPAPSRSHPHLPGTNSGNTFSYRSRYSRSSVSLTRPHRLSGTTPAESVAWSSRSGSTGPDEGRGSPSSGDGSGQGKATPNDIAYAILNGTPIPGSGSWKGKGRMVGHVRRASAPDTSTGAQHSIRKSKGWKPQLNDQTETMENQQTRQSPPIIRSSSADPLSIFSPDTSPDNDQLDLRFEIEKELDLRANIDQSVAMRRIRSEDPIRFSGLMSDASVARAATLVGRMPMLGQGIRVLKSARKDDGSTVSDARAGAKTFEELKNKPLPKIAVL
ncbi:hypothetical protein CC80DRAFT_480898 [Byssothecium circinans]|uniref:Uncharacterized protein n=1 Tax=Byssothecium circinans TaxID=147558 RepID=A0A6A5TLB8_9PLEO|nr:hypothetical protein CC80DRAFT_480898 [Byssothecium circinans]